MPNSDDRVIVVGAGPVGAIMTLALVTKGIPVTLIEAEADAVEDQRAATVHPPTVEMLAKLGLKDVAFSEEPRGGLQSPMARSKPSAEPSVRPPEHWALWRSWGHCSPCGRSPQSPPFAGRLMPCGQGHSRAPSAS